MIEERRNGWQEAPDGAEIDFSALLKEAQQKQKAKEAARVVASDNAADEKEAKAEQNETTFNTSPEQIRRINRGDRAAVDEFFFGNFERLTFSAYRFLRNNAYLKAHIEKDDLINQVYIDLRTGMIKLRPINAAITRAIFTSFRFAAVGGLDEVFIYETKEEKAAKCQGKRS